MGQVKIIRQRVWGVLLADGRRTAVQLAEAETTAVYLAFALVTQGTEQHILPSFLLDDWGNTVKNLALYRWIRDNGQHFPRAEVFGVAPDGVATQIFLRDLELFARYPTYVTTGPDRPIVDWSLLDAILIADKTVGGPMVTGAPDATGLPLREARLGWWRVPSSPVDLAFIPPTAPVG